MPIVCGTGRRLKPSTRYEHMNTYIITRVFVPIAFFLFLIAIAVFR